MKSKRELYRESVEAAEDILSEYFRLPVIKALDPNKPLDFLVIQHRLAAAVAGIAHATEAANLKQAIDGLDIDWPKATPQQVDKVVLAAKQALAKPPSATPKIVAAYESAGAGTVSATKTSSGHEFGFKVDSSFTKTDHRIIAHAASNQALYIRDEFGNRSEAGAKIARKVAADGLAQGLGRYDIAQNMKAALTQQQINRSDAYWNMSAGVFINRSRTYGNLSGYVDGGIEQFVVQAILDEVTTAQCRFMNGRVFNVSMGLQKYQETESSSDPEDVQYTMPWIQTGRDEGGKQILYYKRPGGVREHIADIHDSGVGKLDNEGSFTASKDDEALAKAGVLCPPYHGNCRTTIRPSFNARGMPTPAADYGTTPSLAPPPPRLPTPDAQRGADPFAVPPTPPLVLEHPSELLPMPEATPIEVGHPALAVPEEQAGFAFPEGGISPSPIALIPEPLPPTPLVTTPPVPVASAYEGKKAKILADIAQLANAPVPLDLYFTELQKPPGGPVVLPFTKPSPQAVGGATKKKAVEVLAKDIVVPDWDMHSHHLASALQSLPEGYAPTVVKHGGKYYPLKVSDAAWLVTQEEMGVPLNAKVVDLDKVVPAKKPKAPKPGTPDLSALPPPTGAPVHLPPPVAAPVADAGNILFQQLEGQKGSNAGGVFMGRDGVKRYVKFYDDPAQSAGEHLANQVYSDLGIGGLNSHLFMHNGKLAYASDILEGETLANYGLDSVTAQKFMDGFVADVLISNWDAAGLSMDNGFVLPDGRVIRIDNGGAFLSRAQGERKKDQYLNSISEWEVFFSDQNGAYRNVAKSAGYDSPEDFKADVRKQLKKVLDLEKSAGGWKAYVDARAPLLNEADKQKIVDTLEAKSRLLEKKVDALFKPKPKVEGYFAPPLGGGIKPHASLNLADIPEFHNIPDGYTPEGGKGNVPNHLPSGESLADYRKRASEKLSKITPEQKSAIQGFTGCDYPAIRDYDTQKALGNDVGRHYAKDRAENVRAAFKNAKPEAGTVYRGIDGIDQQTVEAVVRQMGHYKLGKGNVGATSSAAWNSSVAVNGFASGSHDSYNPHQHKIIFKINAKSAVPIETISSFGAHNPNGNNETERLLSRDAKFKVTNVGRWPGRKRVWIVELDED